VFFILLYRNGYFLLGIVVDWTNRWSTMDDKQKEDMAVKELKNGRLAMIGMAGYLASVLIPGSVPALH